ncbi:MAG: DUF5916 domain-containing protein [Melioribacteraceae bacterium]|nr:MAG: DUF5916 domain-containing protein [Melioribacteraceae bacterium]
MRSILLFIVFVTLLTAQVANSDKVLHLKKIDQQIIIDGKIDDIWLQADSVTDFVQYSPYNNEKPTQRTVTKVLTTEDALYCLFICYDNHEEIQIETGVLDDFAGDGVSFMIDTFGDRRTAYKFIVYASGVRGDTRLLDDARNRDYSWDGIWFADTEIYDWGWVAEMEIPYKSIQYNDKLTEWGLDFDRWRSINNEDTYWIAYEENEGQRISKWGSLVLDDFSPTQHGLNLEIYPVGISKINYIGNDEYDTDTDLGLDISYNPSPELKFQFTANPDFAQIEADPYDFNISRYESYFSERRQFFTEGSEVFNASGRDRNSGFYKPIELFYSRRIGKKLPDGNEVPLSFGTRAFGRFGDWEYGGFVARTEQTDYFLNNEKITEPTSYFASVRLKKQILDNSSIGVLYVGKFNEYNNYGVLDIDGAFRGSNWQLSYQLARSIKGNEGDYAFSVGFTNFADSWINMFRSRYIGNDFDVQEIGFVPWRGTMETVGLTGPRWWWDTGYLKSIMIYGGGGFNWEKADDYTDYFAILGYNMQFRDNWGLEINLDAGKSKDNNVDYSSYSANLSSWFNISPNWSGNLWGGYSHTYNFSRDWLAFYSWMGTSFSYKLMSQLTIGTSYDMFIEGNPDGNIEDITFNTRPYLNIKPVNDLKIRIYFDNVFVRSTDKFERFIVGFLLSYNFSPKSWIHFAYNEVQDRSPEFDLAGTIRPNRMHTVNRAGVLKVSYLYYF